MSQFGFLHLGFPVIHFTHDDAQCLTENTVHSHTVVGSPLAFACMILTYKPGLLLKPITRCTALFYLRPEDSRLQVSRSAAVHFRITFLMAVFAKGVVLIHKVNTQKVIREAQPDTP